MVARTFVRVLIVGLLCLASTHAQAQAVDQQRAQSHLGAARALIKPDPPYTAAMQYAQFAGLEKLAGRDKLAREAGYMLLGLMEEDSKTDKDRYLHLIAQAYLDLDQTEDAVRVMERIAKPNISTQNLQLEATKQLTRCFGLQRGVTYARKAFPDTMSRTDVYRKLCYTLAVNGQADTAMEFIDITFDLQEIFIKLDAYRYAAFGLYKAGDANGALAVLEDALLKALPYTIASTKVGMLTSLAITFNEIGQLQRGMQVLALAEKAAEEIEAGNYERDSAFGKIAEAYALLRQRDKALQMVAKTKSNSGSTTLYQRLVEADLLAGNFDRAKQLNTEKLAFFGDKFEVRVALAKLERGDAAGALADFDKLAGSAFTTAEWHREAAAAFARKGQHTALAALLLKVKDADDQFNFHLGAAEGYLGK